MVSTVNCEISFHAYQNIKTLTQNFAYNVKVYIALALQPANAYVRKACL